MIVMTKTGDNPRMQTSRSKLVKIAASVTVLVTAFTLPAAATVRPAHVHKRTMRRSYQRTVARPLTVTKRYTRPLIVTRRYNRDPFHGPAAIITAPVAIAGMIVGLPFRALETVFPARGNPATNPLVLVGAPLHVAGQIAQFPFYVADSAFGAPPNYY